MIAFEIYLFIGLVFCLLLSSAYKDNRVSRGLWFQAVLVWPVVLGYLVYGIIQFVRKNS